MKAHKRVLVWMVISASLLFCGCRSKAQNPVEQSEEKPSNEAVADDSKTETLDKTDAVNTGENDAGTIEEMVDSRGNKWIYIKKDPFVADFSSEALPPVHLDVLKKDMPWGFIQRTQLNWHEDFKLACESPVFRDGLVNSQIQQELNRYYDECVSGLSNKTSWDLVRECHNNMVEDDEYEPYYDTMDCTVKEINDKYTSVLFAESSLWGNELEIAYKTFTFDTKNGSTVTLMDLYKKSKSEITDMVKKSLKIHLKERFEINDDDELSDEPMIEWAYINDYLNDHDNFKSYISGNRAYVVFDEDEISDPGAGDFEFVLIDPIDNGASDSVEGSKE